MTRAIIGPGKYVQGNGVLKDIKEHTMKLGRSFFIIASENGIKRTKPVIEESFAGEKVELVFEPFNGECSENEIERLKGLAEKNNSQVIVGIGGGKVLDTAKAIAYFLKLPVVVVPTVASTDAPCSALSVIYTDEGVFSKYLILPRNPDVVMVDTGFIVKAPARLLAAGMGDALATYFEARACFRSNATTLAGGKSTKAAMALAELCYRTLLEDGLKAKLAVENNACTLAVENIVEANTYLSGIGFESGGLAAAHAIHNGFTVLEECHHMYHGEKVAFGTIVQLVLENSPMEELEEVVGFCLDVGLPVTLEDLGIKEVKEADIRKVAEASCAEGETIHNMPFKVTPEDVYNAILGADALGRTLKNQYIR
ncbi:glycerol dehydrogenase [Thermosediminibacter oceani]|uniref:glycerol dehydrogenase n=1 Tax=Thermosediminibacter oceani TaxID=291990 RepID=UPI00059C66E8|nr:glycerol dehydrogenase [Thermosediminibacter oceani]